MRKAVGQVGLVEVLLPAAFGSKQRLERIRAQGRLAADRGDAAADAQRPTGACLPTLVQLKALLLQQWCRLSDRDLEEALADRLSFRRFCGLGLEDAVPDAMIGHETDHPIPKGRAARRLRRDAFPLPDRLGQGGSGRSGCDAVALTRRGQRSFFGYKAHLAVDQDSNLIREAILTSADIGESITADALSCGDEAAVLADKAYGSIGRREALAETGITDRIMHRRQAGKRQPSWQKWMKVAITPLPGQIGKVFGTMKRRYPYRRVRYRGLLRNRCQLWLLCMAMNLQRADQLTA